MIHLAPEPSRRQAFDTFLGSLLQADWKSASSPMRFSPGLALSDLGLLERKRPGEWPVITEHDEIRTTALWRKFIHFEPWTGGAQ